MTTSPPPNIYDLAALRMLAAHPAGDEFSPLHGAHCLVTDFNGSEAASDAEANASVAAWLHQLPCPSIAIGTHALAAHCDVALDDAHDLPVILNTIANAPLAAMTLVQVLRATPQVSVEQGLLLESLAYATLQGGPEFRGWSTAHPPRSIESLDTPPLLIERNDSHLRIRLNRPERRNAISVEMRDALCEAFQLVAADPSLTQVEISGNGACFSIGGDVDEFGLAPDTATAHAVRSLRLPARCLLPIAGRVSFHLHSACIGAGIELPAFAARVTAAKNAFFQLPDLRVGLIPGAGGCGSLPRRIGRQRTAYMALTGKKISATTALAWGLIDAIAERPED